MTGSGTTSGTTQSEVLTVDTQGCQECLDPQKHLEEELNPTKSKPVACKRGTKPPPLALGLGNRLLAQKGTPLNTGRNNETPKQKNKRLKGEVPDGMMKPIFDPLYNAKCFNTYYEPGEVDQIELYNDFVKIFEWEKTGVPTFDPELAFDMADSGMTNNRFASMCLRLAFHDNSIDGDPQTYVENALDKNGNWPASARYMLTSGADASLLICPEERYHPNNNYDESASRVLRAFQYKGMFEGKSLVEKWNLSYADLLHNCAAAAAVHLTKTKKEPRDVFTDFPMKFGRKDACFFRSECVPPPLEKFRVNDRFALCGPSEVLPNIEMTPVQLNEWFTSRGLNECLWMSLMGTHTTMDNMIIDDVSDNLPLTTKEADVFQMNTRGPDDVYFRDEDEVLDYFSFFLGQGTHVPLAITDPEAANCDWDRDENGVEIPWPMIVTDCKLGLDYVSQFTPALDELAVAIDDFSKSDPSYWIRHMFCGYAILGGRRKSDRR